MQQHRSCDDIIRHFSKEYKTIAPDEDSVAVTRDLWEDWQRSGITPPDIEGIAGEYSRHENGFFYELVQLAEKKAGEKLNIHFCQFTLDRYNAYAFTASDGYIVLIDDVFFQVLYFLCNILVFDAMGVLTNPVEKEQAKEFIQRIIRVNYLNRKRIDFSSEQQIISMLKKDYELTEFANYFFHAAKAFIIAHEIGHHVLGHTAGTIRRVFTARNTTIEADVDIRALNMEYEADSYGYQLFDTLSQTVDNSVYYAYCKYKFPFAPILLFGLFAKLDQAEEKEKKVSFAYNEHPHPHDRPGLYKQYMLLTWPTRFIFP